MSALTVIQTFCQMHALAVPNGLISATDTQTLQLLAILQESLDDMVLESKYNVTTLECVFTCTAGENQGPIESLGGGLFGYYQANFETFYDRTLMRPMYGPLNDTEWQELKALPNPGPFPKFRIRGDSLLINPVPTAPFSTVAFEYMSTFCVFDQTTQLYKQTITADTDTFSLPEQIIRKWMMYRWKQIKGLAYQADYQRAFDMLNNYIARDKVKRRINVAGEPDNTIKPGILVPTGNWNVS